MRRNAQTSRPRPVLPPPYLDPDRHEFPIYVALKLHMHERIRQGVGLPHVTPKWLHGVLEGASRSSVGMAELHGVSTQFLRERLRNLNHGTALQEIRPGMRQALTYMWNEAPNSGCLHSYGQLSALMGGRTFLVLDLARLATRFGTGPMDDAGFVDLFRDLRRKLLERPWYSLRGSNDLAGPEFTRFLLGRQRLLTEMGLLEAAGGKHRLSRKAQLALYWFDLLLHSVDYPVGGGGRSMARSPAGTPLR